MPEYEFPVLQRLERSSSGTLLGQPRGGPPTKLTVLRANIIIEALEEGMSYAIAASRAGINERTLRKWREKGKEGTDPVFHEFYEAMQHAEARWEESHVTNVDDAAFGRGAYDKPNWTASMARLERRIPERYGRKAVHTIEGHDGGPVKFELAVKEDRRELSDSDRERLERARAGRMVEIPAEVVTGGDDDATDQL